MHCQCNSQITHSVEISMYRNSPTCINSAHCCASHAWPKQRPSMRASEQNCSASICLILFLRAKSGSQKEQREAHCRAISGSRAWSGSGLFHIQHAEDLIKAVGRSSETIKEDFKADKWIWGPQNMKLSRVPNVQVHVLCTTPQAVQMHMHKRRGTHLAKKSS